MRFLWFYVSLIIIFKIWASQTHIKTVGPEVLFWHVINHQTSAVMNCSSLWRTQCSGVSAEIVYRGGNDAQRLRDPALFLMLVWHLYEVNRWKFCYCLLVYLFSRPFSNISVFTFKILTHFFLIWKNIVNFLWKMVVLWASADKEEAYWEKATINIIIL